MTNMPKKSNIVLIGMPGSGKSTVGVILAKFLAKKYLDTDILIQEKQGCTLQEIVNTQGYMQLREIEEQVLLSLHVKDHVIATGGSAAYSALAMRHLRKDGVLVFVHADLNTLEQRIHNYQTRGLAKRDDQSFEDLFNERLSLYSRFADITIESNRVTQEDVCLQIAQRLAKIGNGYVAK